MVGFDILSTFVDSGLGSLPPFGNSFSLSLLVCFSSDEISQSIATVTLATVDACPVQHPAAVAFAAFYFD